MWYIKSIDSVGSNSLNNELIAFDSFSLIKKIYLGNTETHCTFPIDVFNNGISVYGYAKAGVSKLRIITKSLNIFGVTKNCIRTISSNDIKLFNYIKNINLCIIYNKDSNFVSTSHLKGDTFKVLFLTNSLYNCLVDKFKYPDLPSYCYFNKNRNNIYVSLRSFLNFHICYKYKITDMKKLNSFISKSIVLDKV